MRTDFTLLSPDDTLESASYRLLEGSGADFPVVDGSGKLLGVLSRPAMLEGLAAHGPESTVARAMVPDVPTISPDDDLRQIGERVSSRRGVSLLVVQDGVVIGVIPAERVAEFELIEGLDIGHAPDETIAEGFRRLEH